MKFSDKYNEIAHDRRLYIDLGDKLSELYAIEESHTIVFMPFFGLIHIYGNQIQPILDYATMMTLTLMNKRFKQLYVYKGETEATYGNDTSESMEILAQKQWILSHVLNETIVYSPFTSDYNDKVNLFENEHTNGKFKLYNNSSFKQLIDEFPLPYKTIFDLKTEEDFIKYIDNTLKEFQKEDELAKVLLVYPTYWIQEEKQLKNFKKIEEYIKSINGTIYYASNYSGDFVNIDKYIFRECHDYKHVCSLQHFSKTYCDDINEQMLELMGKNISTEGIKNAKFVLSDENNEQQLAQAILNLITTRKATLEQVQVIADYYGVDLDKIMNSLEER